jgi:putative ABC transport system permease protein
MLQDLRRATRALLQAPAFFLAAVATFAIGIGANATVFGVVNAVLLRAYPFRAPEQLVALYERAARGDNDRMPLSPANFRDWRDGNRTLEGMSLVADGEFTLRMGSEPERLVGARVSSNFLSVLGASTALGRGFAANEEGPGAPAVAIISHSLWQRRFGGDRGVIGRSVEVNGLPTTIVGVLRPDFQFPPAATAEMLEPVNWSEQTWNRRGSHYLTAIGRLRPNATRATAQRDLQGIADRIGRDFPGMQKGWGANVVAMHEAYVADSRPVLLVLMGAVAAVLLVGCANVANLTLARVTARQRAIAVRAAMGATRVELIRHHLIESVVVGLAGGTAGLVLAYLATRALPAIIPSEIPRIGDTAVDWRVAAFTFAVSLLASVLAGLLPAWRGSRADLAEVLRDGNKGSTAGAARTRIRDLLFVSEVALSLVLLAGAGLAIKSLGRLLAVHPGFAPERVLVGRVSLPRARYADSVAQVRFFDQVLAQLRTVPGVRAAANVSLLPLGGDEAYGAYLIDGRPVVSDQERPMAQFNWASEGYFDAMSIPLKRGRAFTADDRANVPKVAVVNEALVRKQFPGEDGIGHVVRPFGSDGPAFRIVGVVADVKHRALSDSLRPQLYFPMRQSATDGGYFVVRGIGEPQALAGALRQAVHGVDPTIALADVRPLGDVVSQTLARQRFLAQLLGGFAVSALVLALVGIYGVVANTVAQRSAEFGIRVALGAKSSDVLGAVMGGALLRTVIGLALGLLVATFAGRAIASQLYDVRITDPAVFAIIAALLVAAAMLASWLPARRATRVNPVTVLRGE